ncbi:type II 3-dehydroquinate dehydratase [Buchnera aphidicola (Ceratoglyphina bambusae)]|uniref:type II 3-dehydroquinate dehydratase n=1 Tax=Buchnera aphidicola TaxID=9 RepID=UPI0031B86FBA
MQKNNSVLIINGPNLNLLGNRENKIYGRTTLKKLNEKLKKKANLLNIYLKSFQSNSESELINKIHNSKKNINYMIINLAAFTHTSIAIRDALISVEIPFIEVHISNIYSRESFRSNSWISDISKGIICGLGTYGYFLALKTIYKRLNLKNI